MSLWEKILKKLFRHRKNARVITSIYENVLVICCQVTDKKRKEDIWDFSNWESKGIIGWTTVGNYKPFNPEEWRDPDERARAEKIWNSNMIFFGTVYGFSDGSYQLDLSDVLKIYFEDGQWLIIE